MQYLTITATLAALLAPAFAAPIASDSTSTSASDVVPWSITKFQFSRGSDAYDYSFQAYGEQEGSTPGFTATCTGTNNSGFQTCSILPQAGATTAYGAVPTIWAKVNIVTDPSNPDDSIPRVFVKETYSDSEGCSYKLVGHFDKAGANKPVGGTRGSKFQIYPTASAVC